MSKVYEVPDASGTIEEMNDLVESFIKECDELTQKLKESQEILERLCEWLSDYEEDGCTGCQGDVVEIEDNY